MMSKIYRLSWNKTSFFAKILLFMKSHNSVAVRLASTDPKERADGYSALSSTYHSIYGTVYAQLMAIFRPKWLVWLSPVRIALWCVTWLPLGAWCYLRALPLSNKIVRLIGYDGMTADFCDIRQSILRRRGQYMEAFACIRIGLKKDSIKAHTRGLLHIGLAEIYKKYGNLPGAGIEICAAIDAAGEAEKENPRQAARIYRHCVKILDFFLGESFPGNQLRRRARALLQEVGAKDQLLKIR